MMIYHNPDGIQDTGFNGKDAKVCPGTRREDENMLELAGALSFIIPMDRGRFFEAVHCLRLMLRRAPHIPSERRRTPPS
jgi:hypothetical protein